MDLTEITNLIRQQGDSFETFKGSIETRLEGLEIKAGRPHVFGGSSDTMERKALQNAALALIQGQQEKANEYFVEAKAMSAGSDPNGGYVVHDLVSNGMTKIMAEISPIYRLARKVSMPHGGAFEEPVDRDTAEATWVGEAQARPDTTTPQLGLFRCELNEIYAMPKATQKLIDIASNDVLGWLQTKVGEAFAVKEGTSFHTGDGIVQPRGILTFTTAATGDATRTWGQFEHVATGASAAFPTSSTSVNPADVLVDVVSKLKAQYRSDARWLMNKSSAAICRKLKDSEGRHVWSDSLTQGQPAMLLGYPVESDESMPDISASSLSIAFGNLSKAYTIIEQPGTKFLTDPYSDKPNVRLFAYRRVGGGVNNFEALKFLKFA